MRRIVAEQHLPSLALLLALFYDDLAAQTLARLHRACQPAEYSVELDV
jgi:hypothetical protein